MNLESADVFKIEPVGRAAEEAAELGDGVHLRSLSRRRQITDRHVLDHAAAQRAIGSLPAQVGVQHPEPSQTALPRQRLSSSPCT
jgi:hypothetical protein